QQGHPEGESARNNAFNMIQKYGFTQKDLDLDPSTWVAFSRPLQRKTSSPWSSLNNEAPTHIDPSFAPPQESWKRHLMLILAEYFQFELQLSNTALILRDPHNRYPQWKEAYHTIERSMEQRISKLDEHKRASYLRKFMQRLPQKLAAGESFQSLSDSMI
ncbi:MAG: hypothetical protein AAGJ35_08545, partial [Myxococcota bacterium]